MPYRHIIWDWNGTLLDDAWLCVEILNRVLRDRGRPPVTPQQYAEEFDLPVRDYYERLGFDFESEPFEELAMEFFVEYDHRRFECSLRPGAREALAACNERLARRAEYSISGDHRRAPSPSTGNQQPETRNAVPASAWQSVLSAYEQGALRQMVDWFGIGGFFTHIVGLGDRLAGSKTENARRLVAAVALPAGEVLMVGDTVHDHTVARAVGVDCVLVPSGHSPRQKLERTGARVLDDVRDVLSLLA